MDYDSSTKFISSLAKFLQSLCNGYVEFDNGVEVIGHIYLSVDTGKKIDYILNEKVCKTDENSVTFISNSFHAQPAEKPKPPSKKGKTDHSEEKSVENVEVETDGNSQIELRNTNLGAAPQNRNLNSPSYRQGKRPFSPHSKQSGSPGSKKSRNEFQEQSTVISSEDINSISNPSIDPLRGHNAGFSSDSNFPQTFDNGYNPADNAGDETEDRDIKPSMDTDVTFVKEEFTSSSQIEGDDSSFNSLYHSNQSFEGGSSSQYGQQNSSRLNYGGAGERSDFYDPGLAAAHDSGGDQSEHLPSQSQQFSVPPARHEGNSKSKHTAPLSDYVKLYADHRQIRCNICGRTFTQRSNLNRHKVKCAGIAFYPCQLCSRVFYRTDKLAIHMKKMHPF